MFVFPKSTGKLLLAAVVALGVAGLTLQQPSVRGAEVAQEVGIGTGTMIQHAFIYRPPTNMPDMSEQVASENTIAYALDTPLFRTSPTSRQTHFHASLYLVSVSRAGGRLHVSGRRLLFVAPEDLQLVLGSLVGNWLTYTEAPSNYTGSPWTMLARNISTGKVLVLDTSRREGTNSINPPPYGDGASVVWQAFHQTGAQVTSVVRSYDLATHHQRLLESLDGWCEG